MLANAEAQNKNAAPRDALVSSTSLANRKLRGFEHLFLGDNRTAYLSEVFLQKEGLRIPTWKEKFEKLDYGLINTGQKLETLKVMVLGVNPSSRYKNDEDIIRAYLNKWFTEMGITQTAIYNTDLPSNTVKRIETFFEQ